MLMDTAASSSFSSSSSSILTCSLNTKTLPTNKAMITANLRVARNQRLKTKISAVNEVSSAVDPGQVRVTWQIVVGAIAGVTPFVVAGIEFSKRIISQRRCEACGGSGLVLREKDYFRCPKCGGFLPWQSWKRFFSG